MRKIILSFTAYMFIAMGAKAETPNVLYTFIYNKASGGASVPIMVGVVNISLNSQNGTQMGFTNRIDGNFNGAQFGFANIVSGNLRGAQFGFTNIIGQGADGAQFGFANISRGNSHSAQFGFTNIVRGDNNGAQFGFINIAKAVRGFQAGFINIADRYEKGIPLGFLNIVKEGGYQAVEYSVNDLYPLNVSMMTGVPCFYSIIGFSYHSGYKTKFALNAGVGSVFELNGYFDFLPEILSSWRVATKEDDQVQTYILKAKFGYNLFSNLSLIAAPTVSWQHSGRTVVLENNFLDLLSFGFGRRDRLNIGFELSLRYAINKGN